MAVTSAETADPSRPAAQPARLVVVVLVVAVGVPFLVLLVRTMLSPWVSLSDWATIELRVRDVGTSSTPLVGPYSRYGWNHPGPLLFYALALPYRVLGREGKGLLFGTLLVNTGALAAMGLVLWRRGRLVGLAVGGFIVLLLVHALRLSFLIDPWNPYVIALPLLAVTMLSWATADGDARWALPVAFGVGSFAIQSHVGSAFAVVVSIGIAITYLVIDARRAHAWDRAVRPLVSALIVGLFCWVAPVAQQFQSDGGNFGDLWRFWTHGHDHVTGWSMAARLVDAQLALPAPWFTGHETVSPFTGAILTPWHIPFALILLVGALVLAIRRKDQQSSRLCVFALGLLAAAFVSISRIVDTPFVYIVHWLWITGAVTWLAIIWTGVRALSTERAKRVVLAVAAAGIAVLGITFVVGAVHADGPNPGGDENSVAAIAPQLRAALDRLPQPVLVTSPDDLRSGTIAGAVMTMGINAGVDTRQVPALAYVVGKAHTLARDRAASTVVVTVEDARKSYEEDPNYRTIATYDPLTPDERSERNDLRFAFYSARANGPDGPTQWLQSHPRERARLAELDRRPPRIDVFARNS